MAVGVRRERVREHRRREAAETPAVRLIGPGLIGFFWGGFLSGGYLSLPKCDPMWAEGAPPEGNVRAAWPMAVAIPLLSMVTAPAMDYVFLGAVPFGWPDSERSARVFLAMGTGLAGLALSVSRPAEDLGGEEGNRPDPGR